MSSLPAIGTRLSANPAPVAALGGTVASSKQWRSARAAAMDEGEASLRYERAAFLRFARIVAGGALRDMLARFAPPHTAESLFCVAYGAVSKAWYRKPVRYDRSANLSWDQRIALRSACDLAWCAWAKSLDQPVEVVIARANQAREIAAAAQTEAA